MPWKVTNEMNQKIEFAIKAQDSKNFSELCREYGISRKTGYKWRDRFLARGSAGLECLSRKPKSHKQELGEFVICDLIRLKNVHLKWGPKKIRELYRRQHPNEKQPSLSSVKRVFQRAGLVKRRKKRSYRETGRITHGVVATHPNHIWTIDFKGWWLTSDGLKTEPLTIRDEFSRKILAIKILPNTKTEGVMSSFKELFKKYGLPAYIRSDNGSPFACTRSLLGLTRLSAWWLELGIDLERSRPGKPQDNGAHERMHKDIRDELQFSNPDISQEGFDLWKEEYNSERPHESLEMKTPDEVYIPSTQRYDPTAKVDYGMFETRCVHNTTGKLSYQGVEYQITRALGGKKVGLQSLKGGLIVVWFAHQRLCYLCTNDYTVYPIPVEEIGADKKSVNCNLNHNKV